MKANGIGGLLKGKKKNKRENLKMIEEEFEKEDTL